VHPHRTAIRYDGQSVTYTEFAQRVRRLASALRGAGLEAGDRVAFVCGNLPPLLEAHFGVPLAGGVLVPISVRLNAGDIAYILKHSGARFLFVDAEVGDGVRPLRGHLDDSVRMVDIRDGRRTKPLGDTDYEEFLASGSGKVVPWPLKHEDELISLNYTSGTTGKPKGVMVSHRGACFNALGNIIEWGLSAESNVLWTLPMFHCNGWGLTWAATAAGATHVCLRKIEDETIWRLIATERVSHLCGAPSLLAHLFDCPGRPARLSQPLTVVAGGAPPAPGLIEQWEALGARFLHGYGLTETCGACVTCEPQPDWAGLPSAERAQRLRRQGVPIRTGEAVRVVDERLREVPADGETVGEVVVRGVAVTPGYYREPEATARDFREGWFHTGDLAVLHRDGYLELRDRRRDLVILDGENVSSREIEEARAQHPAVEEVAVIGVPDSQHGETPKAFVVFRTGAKATPHALVKFCRERLASFKCPTRVEILPRLPRTPSGKVQKFILREKEWGVGKARAATGRTVGGGGWLAADGL